MTNSHVHAHNQIARHIIDLIILFKPHCAETETLNELATLADDSGRWIYAHALFSKIRGKSLSTKGTRNRRIGLQYGFEEICAKTLYNISDISPPYSAEFLPPFDEDSPYWVLPFALTLAKELGIDASKVQDIILQSPG
jgi:hypothetical protein